MSVGPLGRRELIAALLGPTVLSLVGCDRSRFPAMDSSNRGELLAPNFELGHRIRDRSKFASSGKVERVPVLIVGGGIAGLSAAWHLSKLGFDDYQLLELENRIGGTARSGKRGEIQFPWGAHYVPVPMKSNEMLVSLLEEMGVLAGRDDQGEPVVAEQYLCRQPQERVFVDGQWCEGLYPSIRASDRDLEELENFRRVVFEWSQRRDASGRRLFGIPCSAASNEMEVMGLDSISMGQWLDQNGLGSSRLRWLVDYSCRDDYGMNAASTSAWAGLFYFASRIRSGQTESQEVITWPQGNGRIVEHLGRVADARIRKKHAAISIEQDGNDEVRVEIIDVESGQRSTVVAKHVIFAAPQFLAKHIVKNLTRDRQLASDAFRYGSWLVANVHLHSRPHEASIPMCWDNVIYPSKSLGYVVATHQSGRDHGPTVLTWYYPLDAVAPSVSRKQLLTMGWEDWADVLLADLRVAHRDIASLITRIDFMRWGHAMVSPVVGFIQSPMRRLASKPVGRIHFAASDLSGVALMEEAFDHGLRASREVLEALRS